MPAAGAREEQAGVQPRRNRVERLGGSRRQWHGAKRTRLLAVQLHLAVGEHAPDVHEAGVAVDVATLERQPLLRAQAGERYEQRHRPEARAELVADRLELVERSEGAHLAPLRLRVRHERGRVLVEQLGADCVVEHLP